MMLKHVEHYEQLLLHFSLAQICPTVEMSNGSWINEVVPVSS